MGGDPGTVQSQSESFERNDDAVPRGKDARALFPEAVPVVPQVGRSCRTKTPRRWYGDASGSPAKKKACTDKKAGRDTKLSDVTNSPARATALQTAAKKVPLY